MIIIIYAKFNNKDFPSYSGRQSMLTDIILKCTMTPILGDWLRMEKESLQ